METVLSSSNVLQKLLDKNEEAEKSRVNMFSMLKQLNIATILECDEKYLHDKVSSLVEFFCEVRPNFVDFIVVLKHGLPIPMTGPGWSVAAKLSVDNCRHFETSRLLSPDAEFTSGNQLQIQMEIPLKMLDHLPWFLDVSLIFDPVPDIDPDDHDKFVTKYIKCLQNVPVTVLDFLSPLETTFLQPFLKNPNYSDNCPSVSVTIKEISETWLPQSLNKSGKLCKFVTPVGSMVNFTCSRTLTENFNIDIESKDQNVVKHVLESFYIIIKQAQSIPHNSFGIEDLQSYADFLFK